MKKVVLISTLPPGRGSLSEYGEILVAILNNLGSQLIVLADRVAGRKYLDDSRSMKVIPCWTPGDLFVPLRVLIHIWRYQPDAVLFNLQLGSFGHRIWGALPGLLMPCLVQAVGFPVIAIWHNLPVTLPEPGRVGRYPGWLIRLCAVPLTRLMLRTRVCVVTLESHRRTLEKLGISSSVIGLGATLPYAQNVQPGQHFLTLGKFGTYKRLERLLESMACLNLRYPHLELHIGGCDHPETPGYLQNLRRQWQHLSCVKWLGWISDEGLAETIRSARALILDYETTTGSSGPAHLAASQGRPVIVPKLGDFIALSEDEGLQLAFYEPRCSISLIRILEQALNEVIDLEAMGAHNLDWAARNSMSMLSKMYEKLLQSVLNPNKLQSGSDF